MTVRKLGKGGRGDNAHLLSSARFDGRRRVTGVDEGESPPLGLRGGAPPPNAAVSAVSSVQQGMAALANRTSFSRDCGRTLDGLLKGRGGRPAEVTLDGGGQPPSGTLLAQALAQSAGSGGVSVSDGSASTMTMADALGREAVAGLTLKRARIFANPSTFTVQDWFNSQTGMNAWSPVGQGVIWVRGTGVTGMNDPLRMQALAMHELMHVTLGAYDAGIQKSIRAPAGATASITDKLLEKCITGTGNF